MILEQGWGVWLGGWVVMPSQHRRGSGWAGGFVFPSAEGEGRCHGGEVEVVVESKLSVVFDV